MSFDDELRATMRAHDHEAPRGLTLPSRRRRVWLPAVAAAAVVLGVVGLSVALGRNDRPTPTTRTVSPLSCPARAEKGTKVPDAPDDIAPRDRLVPDRTPTRVVVCSYVRKGYDKPVTGSSRELAGSLAAVRDTLTFVPSSTSGPCTSDLRATDSDDFLIGLTYPSGTVWVAAPRDHCAGSSNGSFDSHVNLSEFARSSAAAGRWVNDLAPAKRRGGCNPVGAGRLGEDTDLVPDHPTALVICSRTGRVSNVVNVHTDFRKLVAALGRPPTRPTTHECQGDAPTTDYTLRFRYARGPDVQVFFGVGCRPELNNQSLQADDADGSILAEVKRLLAAN